MRKPVSLSTKSLLGNLAFMLLLLLLVTGVTFLVLTPVFRVMDEDIAVAAVNRLLDSVEMAARSVGIMARGLAESDLRFEDHGTAMDSFGLDLLMISDEEGRFRESSAWIRGTMASPGPESFSEGLFDLVAPELDVSQNGAYFIFEAPGPGETRDNLYLAMIAFSGDGLRRIVVGRKLAPFLKTSIPIEQGGTLTMEPAPGDLRNPVIRAGTNLLYGKFFKGVDRHDIVIKPEGLDSFAVETVVDVPFLVENILFRLRIPRHSSDLGINALVQITILHAVSFLAIIGLSALWVYAKITRPLKNLVGGIRTWDGIRLPDFGSLKARNDEIGEVAKAFIDMSGEVRSKTKSLEDQARRDGLTGLFNRRRFDEMLIREWNRSKREGSQMAIVISDIDFFKSYNDVYGHQAGDECLRLVARTFGGGVRRPGDVPFRYGGEEFALILAGTDMKGAETVAESIRSSIEGLGIEHRGNPDGDVVTMSFGVAAAGADSAMGPEELLRNADDALYAAKKSGRNRVRASS